MALMSGFNSRMLKVKKSLALRHLLMFTSLLLFVIKYLFPINYNFVSKINRNYHSLECDIVLILLNLFVF